MKTTLRATSSLLFFLLLASPVYAADISDQDLAALKDQIAKLSLKVDQLEAEQKKAKVEKAAAAAAAPAPVALASAPATSSASTTAAPAATASADDVVTKGTFPGSFHIPGTDTSVKIGGYVKADFNEDIGTGYGQTFSHFYAIPLKTDPRTQQGSQSTFGVQQSRLDLETRSPSDWGEVRTYVEGDFFGTAAANGNTNGYGFELRHAFGSVGSAKEGQLLAGQTWSNFQDTTAEPESLDYEGTADRIFVRQPQIRYTHGWGNWTLSGSVESPADNAIQAGNQNAVASANTASTTITPRGAIPDMVARGDYQYASDGYVSVRGLFNQLNVDRTANVTNNDTASKYGYGFAVSGKQGIVDKDFGFYDFYVGNGTGRYVFDVNASGAYYNTATNTFVTQPFYGGFLGVQHSWSEHFRSNLFGGAVRIVNDTNIMTAPVMAQANKYVASGHANLIWQPAPAYEVGIEYMHGYRKVETGVEGNLNRVESSFMYNF